MPHVHLRWAPLTGHLGLTNGTDIIVMDPRQSQVQRRCTVSHELAHIELGHTGGCAGPEEQAARRLAARWLITFDALLDVAAWTESLEEAADELWVDLDTLLARLDAMTSHEKDALVRAYRATERGS